MELRYNGTLDIATGKSRKEKNWKNREIQWGDLVKRISTTHRTAESFAEYLNSKKPRQDEIKDIGGFVGGYLANGKRTSGSVLHRQLLTLDIDFGVKDLWEDFCLLFGNAAAIYSTHKHSPEHPRLRLIMPLNRAVNCEEYEAIGRWIAGQIGIDQFDHTTFQPSRLMYWPSTSKDGEYFFTYQDGEWLDADAVLGEYHNWQDSSEWPISDREGHVVRRDIAKQGDPLEKKGIIGAFCRTYDVHEAIDLFLGDVYEATDTEDRYSYKEGSTGGGLVVYDGKYAFSHHGTDPCSGKLCNAFDLVRIHKYGLKDEDTKEGLQVTALPSFKAMVDFAGTLPEVRKLVGVEKLQAAKGDFADVELEEGEEEPDYEWLKEMEIDRNNKYLSTVNNVVLVLSNDVNLKGRLALDTFEKREIAMRDLPWRKVHHNTRYLVDSDDANIRHYLEATYGISGREKIKDGLDVVLQRNAFHPVRNYLNQLDWDGVQRVDNLLIDYMGAEDSDYTRAVTRKALCAAVTRIFRPGAKFDYVLVLVGKQGQKKSMIFDKLGMEWFSDSLGTVQGKEALEALQGSWIIEMAELAGLRKAEVEQVKHFITKREDKFRVAYGRRTENFPRQCVFFGTSNNKDFLRDPTGNRRFWPVDTYTRDPLNAVEDISRETVGQIWAEVVQIYRQGETLYLPAELEEIAYKQQEEHTETDEREGLITAYLDKLLPTNWDEMDLYQRRAYLNGEEAEDLLTVGVNKRRKVCVAEIWEECLGGFRKDMTTHNTKFIHDIMRALEGWQQSKLKVRFKGYGVQRGYLLNVATKKFSGNKTDFSGNIVATN